MSSALSVMSSAALLFFSLLKLRLTKWRKYALITFKSGRTGPSIAMWAITTRCDCKCKFCKVWRKPTIEPSPEEALQTVDALDAIGCYILSITGGEPLLYPYIKEVIDYAHEKGFIVQVNTNGSLLSQEVASISKADLITISLDYPDEKHDKVRGHPHLFRKVLNGANLCRRMGLRVDFSTLLLGDQDIVKLIDIAQNFDATLVLSYPGSGGSLHADNWNLPSRDWLQKTLELAIRLKKENYPVFNTLLGLRGAIEYLRDERRLFPCCAGESMIYLDWDGWVYPCLFLRKMCHVKDLQKCYSNFPKFYSCTECYDQAWSDPSAIMWLTKSFRLDSNFRDLFQIGEIAMKMV
ncbi:MAG: radical SAM protein [Candidatus Bathyarchaeota archaeon]|nr:radical SAM protein [Candidatus Bathyarchaeota archaeon]